MKTIMNKINQFRYKKVIVIFLVVVSPVYISGCYTSKELVIEGSQLRDKESYDDINYIELKDSTKIKFGDKELGYEAGYINKYKNINDVILYVSKIDTSIVNNQIQIDKKYDFAEVKNILKADVIKNKINGLLTAGVFVAGLAALLTVLIYVALHSGGGFISGL